MSILKDFLKPIVFKRKVIVGGMESTGSTFVYQIIKGMGISPVKTHGYVSYGRIKIVTYRDPRDVICSYARRQQSEVSDEKGIDAGLVASHERLFHYYKRHEALYQYRQDPCAVLCRYEQYFGGHEGDLIDFVANHLGLDLDQSATQKLLSEYSIEKNKRRSEQLGSFDKLDKDTQVHGNHISNAGRTGAWRTLFTPAIREIVKRDLGGLLIDFGYEKDLDW